MYENAGTYRKYEGFEENCMCMKLNGLSRLGGSGAEKKRNKKMKEGPTMCVKTKENESDILEGPTMFIKTNGLILRGHDVDEK